VERRTSFGCGFHACAHITIGGDGPWVLLNHGYLAGNSRDSAGRLHSVCVVLFNITLLLSTWRRKEINRSGVTKQSAQTQWRAGVNSLSFHCFSSIRHRTAVRQLHIVSLFFAYCPSAMLPSSFVYCATGCI
jgi:hypothetical protein